MTEGLSFSSFRDIEKPRRLLGVIPKDEEDLLGIENLDFSKNIFTKPNDFLIWSAAPFLTKEGMKYVLSKIINMTIDKENFFSLSADCALQALLDDDAIIGSFNEPQLKEILLWLLAFEGAESDDEKISEIFRVKEKILKYLKMNRHKAFE